MFDAHIHVTPPRLPGVGSLHPRLEGPADAVADWLRSQMAAAGVTHCLALGSTPTDDDSDPLGVARSLEIAQHVPGLLVAGIADPRRNDPEHLRRAARFLETGRVHALKAYLGYLHYEPAHAHYRPYYELAERFHLPVYFHTGDTFSPLAKLKFTHPLGVDEVAVDHPKVRFILCHCGNPWLTDAAAVIYKNVNVWADLSGLIVADPWPDADDGVLEEVQRNVLAALKYAERPNRILFGTDWPLVGMKPYRDWIAGWLPEAYHDPVFRDNARMLLQV